MKMRGCSVLFVCALCVFVLCGAAAVVVAQNGAPGTKAAEAARADADVAKAKGEEALANYTLFESSASNVSSMMSNLTATLEKIAALEIPAGEIKQETEDQKEQHINGLKAKAEAAKTAVEALRDAQTLMDEQTKTALTNITKEVDLYMKEVENAVADLSGNTSAINAAIEKAGALEAAADKAGLLWHIAMGDLTTQIARARASVNATNITKDEMEDAVTRLEGSNDQKAINLKKELSDIIEKVLTPSLEKLISLRDAAVKAKDAAYFASKGYDSLAEKARTFKQAVEKGEQQETEDYSAAPFCSLALPVFFFCWCVLFGM